MKKRKHARIENKLTLSLSDLELELEPLLCAVLGSCLTAVLFGVDFFVNFFVPCFVHGSLKSSVSTNC